MKTKKYELAVALASHILTLPAGGWPETEQAERDLDDALPDGETVESMIEAAARRVKFVHSSRREWLAEKGRKYAAADEARVYPALAR